MRGLRYEIKRCFHIPYVLASIVGIVIGCLISIGYTSDTGKSFTVLELILQKNKDFYLTDVSLNRYDMWISGIGDWAQILLPLLLGIGFFISSASDRESGYLGFKLIREGRKTCSKKIQSWYETKTWNSPGNHGKS